jgi:phosphate acetyltransferase
MPEIIENRTFDEIRQGETASSERSVRPADLRAWASAFNETGGGQNGAAGLTAAWFAALAETRLPGFGSTVRSVNVNLRQPLPVGAALTSRLTVREKRPDHQTVVLDGQCADASGAIIASAVLEVAAPPKKIRRPVPSHRLDGFLTLCRRLPPLLTGVVYPLSAAALAGAAEAAEAELIEPVLFGPKAAIRALADKAEIDLSACRFENTANSEEAAAHAAAASAGAGGLRALMKGSLHTGALLHAVLEKEAGLRAGRLLSHCAMISAPTYQRRFVLTDVALNIAPTTDEKRGICQNAIGFARALGIETPKVAVLAAVEVVNTRMSATLDGAILAKMADRRQIVGGIVDGPLDLDAAVDAEAARIKHIVSPVAGAADVLLVPNIEAGNMVYKDLTFMADAQAAGLVVGARVPIILTSRADTPDARRFSAAAAVLYAEALTHDPSILNPQTAE